MKTTMKTMMAMAFATFALTANANTKGNTWRNPTPSVRIEVRNDIRTNRHYETNWRTCRHNHLDRYGNKTFCHTCGVEMVWKGNSRTGHYEIIPPRPVATHNHCVMPTHPKSGNMHRR